MSNGGSVLKFNIMNYNKSFYFSTKKSNILLYASVCYGLGIKDIIDNNIVHQFIGITRLTLRDFGLGKGCILSSSLYDGPVNPSNCWPALGDIVLPL